MASIMVFQDQENASQDHGIVNMGLPRVAPKPFNTDYTHQATPRKALGDVRNIQIPKQNSSMKGLIQSDKKVPTSVSLYPKSSFKKPFGTAKKTAKCAIPILEDDATGKLDVKGKTKVKQLDICSLQDKTQKENCFPFIDTDFQFSVPNYLKDLSSCCISDNIWLPPFTWCKEKKDIDESVHEPPKIETECLLPRSDLEGSLFDDVMTDFLEFSTDPLLYPDKFCELGDIESDLANIDISSSLSIDYPEMNTKLDGDDNDNVKLCRVLDTPKKENTLNTAGCSYND